jgi:hypothetical protein
MSNWTLPNPGGVIVPCNDGVGVVQGVRPVCPAAGSFLDEGFDRWPLFARSVGGGKKKRKRKEKEKGACNKRV